jgi:hypothetical protein
MESSGLPLNKKKQPKTAAASRPTLLKTGLGYTYVNLYRMKVY